MRNYVLFHAEHNEPSEFFPVVRRLFSNWRKRRRLQDLQQLDDRALTDIGLTRADVMAVLGQPMSVDPVWDLERRARRRRSQAIPGATTRWLNDRAFDHPRIEARH